MTTEEKEERRAQRAASVEAKELAEINAVWDQIPFELRKVFIYIAGRIAHESDPAEIKHLRESRALHFGPVRRRLQRGLHESGSN